MVTNKTQKNLKKPDRSQAYSKQMQAQTTPPL